MEHKTSGKKENFGIKLINQKRGKVLNQWYKLAPQEPRARRRKGTNKITA